MLISSEESMLLIIDVQEKLAPNMHDIETVMANIVRLAKSAQTMNVPVFFTEHCPDKIGPTVKQLIDYVNTDSVITKTHFSACAEPRVAARLKDINRKQVIVTGAEAHVCVLQTALLLKQSGYQPFLVTDGTSSRRQSSKEMGITRMRQNDVEIVTTEMVIFEWLQRADTDLFRQLLPLIRDF